MTGRTRVAVVAATLGMCAVMPARGDEAEQLAGLFVQGCLRFAGDIQGLRQWAAQLGLRALPPGGQTAFMQAQTGIAYDATTEAGKFVVISADDGACSAIAERGDPILIDREVETALTRLGVGFTVSADAPDPREPALHHREYQARKDKLAWRIVVSTGAAGSGAHPMITAISE